MKCNGQCECCVGLNNSKACELFNGTCIGESCNECLVKRDCELYQLKVYRDAVILGEKAMESEKEEDRYIPSKEDYLEMECEDICMDSGPDPEFDREQRAYRRKQNKRRRGNRMYME